MGTSSPMILVIGEGPYKASTAAVLLKCGYNVKETTDISLSRRQDEQNTLTHARRWISKNSLRRLDGQNVKIICAMDAALKDRYDQDWVNILSLIFKVASPCVAAVLQHTSLQSHLETFLDLFFKHGNSTVLEAMDDGSSCVPCLRQVIEELKPFRVMIDVVSTTTKAWSSEKVILFGRSGSGKSTIAQMLTLGRLDPSAYMFRASSSARGMTSRIGRAEGRGWRVTDTPGFGEAKEGTVSTKDATHKIKKFVIETCGIYCHYLYVVKKDRMNVYDERLWTFFKKVFKDAEDNFSVVVTGCTAELSSEDKAHLRKTFEGCQNFIMVDFCQISTGDSELEMENKEVRAESLVELEDGLARLGVADKECYEGMYSKESLKIYKSQLRSTLGDCSGKLGKDFLVEAVHQLLMKPVAAVAALVKRSEIDENFILIPQ